MNLLLDTQIVLRWLNGDLFPKRLVTQIEKAGSLAVSMVTPWEITIKTSRHQTQKLISAAQLSEGLTQMGARLLHIQRKHMERLATLPEHHHDPFDRMLIAQAKIERLTLLTADAQLKPYGDFIELA